MFSLHEDKIKDIKTRAQDNLDWLIELELDERMAQYEQRTFEAPKLETIKAKIDSLNEICENLYDGLIGAVNDFDVDILPNNTGTKISDLMNRN